MLDGPDEDGQGALGEKSPYEPEEFDPSSLGPDIPEAPDPPEGAANTEVTALFWKLVVVFNIALLALSVGPMLYYFEGRVDLGIRVTLAGAIAFAYGYFRYRQFVKQRDSDESADEGPGDEDDDPTDHNG
ncbi:DUF7322 domain-containing protein [Haloarcula rara]|uniref:DUF7322 domain-containing protein n=1 Tax=Haloarcula rara TaxID=3033387 RepID=UPI0023E794C7|nr:hypothetical protein [Halomicroarcula sp. SHR3]